MTSLNISKNEKLRILLRSTVNLSVTPLAYMSRRRSKRKSMKRRKKKKKKMTMTR
jgi:hypothetical protein